MRDVTPGGTWVLIELVTYPIRPHDMRHTLQTRNDRSPIDTPCGDFRVSWCVCVLHQQREGAWSYGVGCSF